MCIFQQNADIIQTPAILLIPETATEKKKSKIAKKA